MAVRTALKLTSPNILECLPLMSGVSIEEIAPPERFIGKSLRDLDLRNKYGIQVIAVRELVPERTLYVPPADFVIKDSDVLIVMGDEKMLEKMTAS
jgi:trk system potassium uptake protein TrkA